MSDIQSCLLTTKDYTILEVMLDRRLGRDDPILPLLRRKLSEAVVMFRDDIPATAVTLNSRVAFRVDDNPAETRIVAPDETRGLVGLTIPLTNRRGLALLGLSEGQSVIIDRPDGRTERIAVLQVVYQPEAARREESKLRPQATKGPFLRVVHRSDDLYERPANRTLVTATTDFDDPGPSAA